MQGINFKKSVFKNIKYQKYSKTIESTENILKTC